MATLNDFSVADGNQYVLAQYYNLLLGSILRKEFSNAVTMSATVTLTDGDTPIQRLNCNGANRIVRMPPGANGNHPFMIINTTSSGSWTLTVQSNDGAIALRVLAPGESVLVVPDGNGAYKDPACSSGFIQENSAQLVWDSNTGYHANPGSAVVNGTLLVWSANITRSSLSLSANTLYYVYLYSNSGTPAVEESTTVPVWDSGLNYYKKTGDQTRRCIGYFSTNASSQIRKFLNTVMGRVSEFILTDGVDAGTSKRVVSGGTVSGSWQSFSLSPFVPAHATHAYLLSKLVSSVVNDDGIIGLSPIDLGSSVGNEAPFQVRGKIVAASQSIFFGTSWLAISSPQTYYYRLQHVVGTGSQANIEVYGARILR